MLYLQHAKILTMKVSSNLHDLMYRLLSVRLCHYFLENGLTPQLFRLTLIAIRSSKTTNCLQVTPEFSEENL